MIGGCPRGLEPCNICQIRNFARRFKGGDERRKVVTIGCEQRRAWWLFRHEDPRHRGKELFTYDFLDHGEAIPKCLPKAYHHIVAVDPEASRGNGRIVGGNAARNRLVGVEQRIRKRCLERCMHGSSHAADAREARERISRAAIASAHSVGQSGTSLSHSIRVGISPERAMTCA